MAHDDGIYQDATQSGGHGDREAAPVRDGFRGQGTPDASYMEAVYTAVPGDGRGHLAAHPAIPLLRNRINEGRVHTGGFRNGRCRDGVE